MKNDDTYKVKKDWSSVLTKMENQSKYDPEDKLTNTINYLISCNILPKDYIFDDDSKKTLQLIEDGEPVIYLSGKAGTGKSTFVNLVKNITDKIHVLLAPTGIASLNIGGQTIHSFFRFPPKINSIKDIRMNYNEIVDELELIIIDEVSMVRADVMNMIDEALRLWRNNDKPFGGIQMLFVGDCYQLSPVVNSDEREVFEKFFKSPWFFDSRAFDNITIKNIELKNIYRQHDETFIKLLNNIRCGVNLENTINFINKNCYNNTNDDNDIYLTTTNRKASYVNDQFMSTVEGKEHLYKGIKTGKMTFKDNNLPVPVNLILKEDARVMIRKNISGAINGSLGIVKECLNDYIIIKLDSGKKIEVVKETWKRYKYVYDKKSKTIISEVVGKYKQLPVILGWAITIHKSQGLTLDNVYLDLDGSAFSFGQTYVALSRCRTLKSISLVKNIDIYDIMVSPRIKEYFEGGIE